MLWDGRPAGPYLTDLRVRRSRDREDRGRRKKKEKLEAAGSWVTHTIRLRLDSLSRNRLLCFDKVLLQ